MKMICSNELNENDFFEWVERRRFFQMCWLKITSSNKLNKNHFFQTKWMKTSSSNENNVFSFQSTARRTRVISLEETTWSGFHFRLDKILSALGTSDERILTKQAFDLDWTLSRDFLATVLVKILFALTISDERIFIKSNSNSAFVWLNCEQSANLDVLSLKRRLFNLKNRHRQKTRFSLFDLQHCVDRK